MHASGPTDPELVELFDRLWRDPRRRDDRSDFAECAHCGRAIRWIANLGSRRGSSLPIIARPVTTAAWFRPHEHAGLVAVFSDRTGFTVSHATGIDELDDAFLYPCHWDVCEHARTMRDRLHRERATIAAVTDPQVDPEIVRRYDEWRGRQPE